MKNRIIKQRNSEKNYHYYYLSYFGKYNIFRYQGKIKRGQRIKILLQNQWRDFPFPHDPEEWIEFNPQELKENFPNLPK